MEKQQQQNNFHIASHRETKNCHFKIKKQFFKKKSIC